MPISAVIHLSPSEDITLRPMMGQHAHDIFLTLLRIRDPKQAEELHATSEGKKPFTVSPLIAKGIHYHNQLHLQAGTECKFRFTFLKDTLFKYFAPVFFTDPLPSIPLGQANFQINHVRTPISETEGWSDAASYDLLIDMAQTETRMQIRFHSPPLTPLGRAKRNETSINRNEISINLVSLYQSWVNKWNTFSPIWMDKDKLLEFVENRAGMTDVDFKQRTLDLKTRQITGFIGTCTYQFFMEELFVDPDDLKMLRYANLLADYAFYCGTGYKTTMGMGQTRRE